MNKKHLSFSDKACVEYCEKLNTFIKGFNRTHFDLALLCAILIITLLMAVEAVFAQSSTRPLHVDGSALQNATCAVLAYLEGSFGALVMVASGVGAIISAAFGQYRASLGMMVVAIGSFILRSLAVTFFGHDAVLGGKCDSD